MLTANQVTDAVAEIYKLRDDPEAAHSAEDDLYLTVLKAIASGTCEDPPLCAQMAVMTQEIYFPRWCA